MGATGWQYTVPYQSDMQKVMDDLKAQVFASGEYEHPGYDGPEWLEDMGFFEADPDEREAMIEEYGMSPIKPLLDRVGVDGLLDALKELADAPLTSFDDLNILMCFSSSGTGSILDVYDLAEKSGGYGLYPLPEEQLIELLGTTRATEEMVETGAFSGGTDSLYKRGEGFYVVLYTGDKPDKIYIRGCSGD